MSYLNKTKRLQNLYKHSVKFFNFKIKRMENQKTRTLLDFSPEAVAIRREKIKKEQELGERIWREMYNEGNQFEKSYWIKGFIVGLNHTK